LRHSEFANARLHKWLANRLLGSAALRGTIGR